MSSLVQLPSWGWGNVAVASLQILGLGGCVGELKGENAGYSKFAHAEKAFKVPSRMGMVILYSPALAASLYYLKRALAFQVNGNGRETITAGLLVIHFGKRVLECLFLHNYSGTMDGDFVIPISISYMLTSVLVAHQQLQVQEYSHQLSGPVFGLGLGLSFLGQLGNFYHHFIWTRLRKASKDSSTNKYVVPHGGLFRLVTMPHYFCEIISWFGLACVTQQFNAFLVVGNMTSYLAGRSVATTRWYKSKFGADYPPERKHLLPFLF